MIRSDDVIDGSSGRRVLTVRQLNEEISAAMQRAFPSTVWVRGEIQRLPSDADRRTHVYFELHETGGSGAAEYAIPVSLMGWDRKKFGLGRYLDGTDPDLQLANQLEVCLECRIDFYAKFGKLSLKIVGIDRHFSLGRLEARRREILAYLQQADLLEANGAVPMPELPLRVGLITAAGSAAERDFMTGLEASHWNFVVSLRGARMQGEQLQREVIAALCAHAAAGVDVIVITRGGGSRADLSWFDQQDLAEAIARAPVPVIAAIGHEIDRSIADLVAHRSCKTPTAAAEFLVERVGEAALRVETAAERLADATVALLSAADRRLSVADRLDRVVLETVLQARLQVQGAASALQRVVSGRLSVVGEHLFRLRSRLGSAAAAEVSNSRETLGVLRAKLAGRAAARLTTAGDGQVGLMRRLAREAHRPMKVQTDRLAGLAVQVRLLDPARLLARGYTITVGPGGRALTRADQAAVGDRITTRFSDGEMASVVQPDPSRAAKSQSGKDKRSGGKKGEEQTDTGQESLFR